MRRFDEAADDKAVVAYCTKRIKDQKGCQFMIDTFRGMRKELAPQQGQLRKTWLQAILIGDIAIVGVPGEFFTVLGQEIKRRSPFRYHLRFRAGQRLHRLYSRSPRLRARGIPDLDGTA